MISAALKNERQNDSRSKEKSAAVRGVEEVKRAAKTAAQRPETRRGSAAEELTSNAAEKERRRQEISGSTGADAGEVRSDPRRSGATAAAAPGG